MLKIHKLKELFLLTTISYLITDNLKDHKINIKISKTSMFNFLLLIDNKSRRDSKDYSSQKRHNIYRLIVSENTEYVPENCT
jgi:hypothetical protein